MWQHSILHTPSSKCSCWQQPLHLQHVHSATVNAVCTANTARHQQTSCGSLAQHSHARSSCNSRRLATIQQPSGLQMCCHAVRDDSGNRQADNQEFQVTRQLPACELSNRAAFHVLRGKHSRLSGSSSSSSSSCSSDTASVVSV
jgi:hypothetical protein